MNLFLQAQQTAPASVEQGFEQTFIMLAIALVFFYFILWRPEQKKKKQMDEMRSSMKKGDRVMVAGILGEVYKVNSDTVIVKLVEGAKMEVLKAAINEIQGKGSAAEKEEEKVSE